MPPLTKKELLTKKKQAVNMFIVKGLSQKEIARLLNLSETTLSKWAIKYDWKEGYSKKINRMGGVSALMKNFFEYVRQIKPEAVDSFKSLWTAFLQSEEKKLQSNK